MERVNGGNWTSSARGARIPMPTFARDFRQATLVLLRRGELHFSMESLSFVSKGAKTAVFWSFYRDCDSKRFNDVDCCCPSRCCGLVATKKWSIEANLEFTSEMRGFWLLSRIFWSVATRNPRGDVWRDWE